MSDLRGEIYKAVEFYSLHDKRQDKIRITANGIDEIISMVLDEAINTVHRNSGLALNDMLNTINVIEQLKTNSPSL